jgi:septal ring factor EnvC (AmiA/AmiB activator)
MVPKNNFTIPAGIVWAIIVTVCSVVVAYYTSQASIADQINDSSSELYSAISSDRERLSKTEEAITTIKSTNLETQRDIKEILRILK